MKQYYATFVSILLHSLTHENSALQAVALTTLMNLAKRDSMLMSPTPLLDAAIMNELVPLLLTHYNPNRSDELLDRFTEDYLIQFDDVRYHTVASITYPFELWLLISKGSVSLHLQKKQNKKRKNLLVQCLNYWNVFLYPKH